MLFQLAPLWSFKFYPRHFWTPFVRGVSHYRIYLQMYNHIWKLPPGLWDNFFFFISISQQKSHGSHDCLSPRWCVAHSPPEKAVLLQLISFTRTCVLVRVTFKTILIQYLVKLTDCLQGKNRDIKNSLWITGPMLAVATVVWCGTGSAFFSLSCLNWMKY